MFLESPESYKFTLHVITAIASPLHVLGIYCILFLTPKTMGSAKWYLLNFHVICILLDWELTVLSVPYMIFPALGRICIGDLKNLVWSTISCAVILLHDSFAPTTAILIFENRFYQLYARNSFWRYLRIPLIILNYFLDATYLLPAIFLIPDQKIALELAFELIPNLPNEIKLEPLFILSFDYWVIIPFMLIASNCKNTVQVCVFIGLINRNMNLESKSFTRSENTINLQRKFVKSIKAQLMVLGINILLPLTYSCYSIHYSYYNQFANNLVIIGVSLHGINSSLIMLWAHKTYREYCSKNFKKIRRVFGCISPISKVSTKDSVSILTLT